MVLSLVHNGVPDAAGCGVPVPAEPRDGAAAAGSKASLSAGADPIGNKGVPMNGNSRLCLGGVGSVRIGEVHLPPGSVLVYGRVVITPEFSDDQYGRLLNSKFDAWVNAPTPAARALARIDYVETILSIQNEIEAKVQKDSAHWQEVMRLIQEAVEEEKASGRWYRQAGDESELATENFRRDVWIRKIIEDRSHHINPDTGHYYRYFDVIGAPQLYDRILAAVQ